MTALLLPVGLWKLVVYILGISLLGLGVMIFAFFLVERYADPVLQRLGLLKDSIGDTRDPKAGRS